MVWKLDAAVTAECCHVAVYRRCSTADAVADATKYTRCKNSWTIGGGADTAFCKYAHDEIPNSTKSYKPWIGFHFATHYNADQRTRNAANRCVLRAYNAAKCNCGRAPP